MKKLFLNPSVEFWNVVPSVLYRNGGLDAQQQKAPLDRSAAGSGPTKQPQLLLSVDAIRSVYSPDDLGKQDKRSSGPKALLPPTLIKNVGREKANYYNCMNCMKRCELVAFEQAGVNL